MQLIHFLLFQAFEVLIVLSPFPVPERLKDLSLAARRNDKISLFGGLGLKLDCLGTQLSNLFAKVRLVAIRYRQFLWRKFLPSPEIPPRPTHRLYVICDRRLNFAALTK